jgi:hypothetical protein
MEVNKIVLDLKVCVSILDSNIALLEYARSVYYYFEESAKHFLFSFLLEVI